MKILVTLARVVREIKTIVVDVPDDWSSFPEWDKNACLSELYDVAEEQEYTSDSDWGCDEATHIWNVSSDESEPEFRIDDELIITKL